MKRPYRREAFIDPAICRVVQSASIRGRQVALIDFFDCNCTLGSRTMPRPESHLSDHEILCDLARHGISAALCMHAHARELHPTLGNAALKSLKIENPPVHVARCFVVMPHHTGEMPRSHALVGYLKEGGAAAVRIFPKDHALALDETSCGELLSAIEDAALPLLLDLVQTGWQEVDSILLAHPALRLIVLRIGYREDRRMCPLLERHQNLFIETSYYVGHRAIEHVVNRFGAGRLVFGTGAPLFAPGGAIAPITYAEISEEEKAAIAGGNLRRLLAQASVIA